MKSIIPEPSQTLTQSDSSDTLCLANARLVLPDGIIRGRVTISGGTIIEISERDDVPAGGVDCDGDLLIPGLVELHTDNLERHIEPRPEVHWPHLPALVAHDAELASTGITTVFDALRVGSIHDSKARHKAYARGLADELLGACHAGIFKISHFLHLRAEICSETLLEEMAQFGTNDRIGIVSLMDHTPGQRQFRDLEALKTYVGKKRGILGNDFEAHVRNLKDLQDRYAEAHERGAIKEAKRYGAVLASHDDTTKQHVMASKSHGVALAEFPTTLEAARACRSEEISVMMGAPNIIRGKSHSGNVSALELADSDVLDIVSSDYVPSALLLAAFHLAKRWDDLPRAIACVTHNPATAAGLKDRGRISEGLRADLVRVGQYGGAPLVKGVWCLGRRVS